MKTWITQTALGLVAFAAVALTSCEKDETRVMLNMGAAPALTASASNAVLRRDDAAKEAVTYSWTPATYGYQAAVAYTLQFDKRGNDFKAPKDIDAGSALTKTLTVAEVNSIFTDLKLPAGTPAQLDVRVKSSVGASVEALMSAATSLAGTPYESREVPKDTWALIGPAGISWDTDVVMTYNFDEKVWTITTDLKADFFKFRANKKWDLNLGALAKNAPSASGPLKTGGEDIKNSEVGNYTIKLKFDEAEPNKSTYTIKKN
ncbi:hypothetical protein SAMN00120144_1275 [Hymenobacter roseosalivarius DSM 11622]|uniref:SusE outer membrane protein domain-containing protein n=1 Tax=Hymenobacter roseosalivarius DSM 11622 TaxID=645990 RepID=A0A1W1W557_9BACT|nr:SusE domain-containing protein [Hymenobacter roseosalivarius]SMC00521.1 hypothetical protein SAMN00120144_1275 [Hymenobacter roseosalivarius DSM 11622]